MVSINRTMSRMVRRQRGFTMIELGVVALIITVITVLAVPRARDMIIENRANSVAREILVAAGKIRASREGAGPTPYSTVNIAELGALLRGTSFTVTPAAPAAATAIQHTLGSSTWVGIVSENAGRNFVIVLGGIDRAACVKLASLVAPDAFMVAMHGAGGPWTALKATWEESAPLNAALAQATCTDTGNQLNFSFR